MKYIEYKDSEEKLDLDFETFSKFKFDHGYPEILIDLIFYLTGHMLH